MPKIIIFSAPSGCGKDSIVHELNKNSDFVYSISATTRQKRQNEINGQDYIFISLNDFKEKIKNKEFLEYQEVYENCFYGTLKSEIDRLLKGDKDILMILDVNGALNIKKLYKEECLTIFIKPPSIQVLKDRLLNRNTDTIDSIEKRLAKAISEMEFSKFFDYQVINDNFDDCINKIKNILKI
ncbi:MAG: guanylate kinase [Wendovervirus sonii]|uniref:guanylate kinase n=1 Tax=phage Lak_Megaphage_Sonny TaxID=3109229 RepID=A0ABZ0Z6K7_9CAUD|nr:MAG: guanylate kinase [phage Lak_Megaphage_Sonny]